MKKLLSLLLAAAMTTALLTGCGGSSGSAEPEGQGDVVENEASDVKFGIVLIGDENEGYTYAHIEGIKKALATCGLDESNVIWKYSIPEDESCYDAIIDCIDQGCVGVFTNSYGHQSFAQQAAEEYPEAQITSMTGDTAKASGLENFHNAFTEIYEARYVGGVVAGMKIAELEANGELTDKNYDADGKVKIGYVGAYPYAEVVSGYTAFFLGIKSVYENVSMEVQYTNSWFDITKEGEAATALIDDGCVIIGQHADSTGAPAVCEEALQAGTVVYSVGYNVDMLAAAPNAALTSPTNEWDAFYTYAFDALKNGKSFDQNWAEGFDKDAVNITELGPNCAEGTAEKVEEIIAGIKDGSIHVFANDTFTVDGAKVEEAFATDTDGDWTNDADNAMIDGYYHESYFQSAPSFSLRIDGIKELN